MSSELPAQQTVSGSIWEQAIREALSREFLSDGDRDLLLEAYQARDWKPLFITSSFELEAGRRTAFAAIRGTGK